MTEIGIGNLSSFLLRFGHVFTQKVSQKLISLKNVSSKPHQHDNDKLFFR